MFGRRKIKTEDYDKENKKPVIRASICTGEQAAGFKDVHTGGDADKESQGYGSVPAAVRHFRGGNCKGVLAFLMGVCRTLYP